MRVVTLLATALSASAFVEALPADNPRSTNRQYVGYLFSTFSDPTPQVQWHLSDGNSASSFNFLNGGKPVVTSGVGTKGVRDIFLKTNTARSEYFTIATGYAKDLDINAPGFSWDLRTDGLPCPKDTGLIDQEFLYLGKPGHFACFLKNDTINKVYQKTTTTGRFGTWTRVPGYVRPESPLEGPCAFADLRTAGLYHLLLDDYTQYIPSQNSNILSPNWEKSDFPNFPKGLTHGSVTPLTKKEYDAVVAKFRK
ncbi:hypothetical protein FGADI_1298 [Fusarium gaditjirri]|uniref:Uncharacterized protein n=1 Tax=Fusarium gaditjirri TaxID=282569 RepID=A0A8H4TLP0_9HYPO|nr:hypothetical protein FGADI_1298 [Fusarium gaditjirri]